MIQHYVTITGVLFLVLLSALWAQYGSSRDGHFIPVAMHYPPSDVFNITSQYALSMLDEHQRQFSVMMPDRYQQLNLLSKGIILIDYKGLPACSAKE